MSPVLLALTLSLAAAEPTVDELMRTVDDMARGKSSAGTMTMHVKTARWERTMSMQVWSRGTDQTLVRILSPAKEKGTATLKVGENIWNYLPNVDRTIKVPSTMMSGSWMGSHFNNDDLVRSSRLSRDFVCRMTARPSENPARQYGVECVPRPDAAVVWGRVALKIAETDRLPRETTFYDERGNLMRTIVYSDVANVGGRLMARRMTLTPSDKPNEFTEISYGDFSFDAEVPDTLFTLQSLKR
jgi:outer membrane lipoprotein-sorting protein